MPSKSNKNKWSLPPYPPTEATICIPVTIPNDDRWIGLFLGQLYRLSQQIWYDRDEQHTAKLVAAVWSNIYLETVKRVWACEGDGMFDVRVNPTDECSIEKTLDGGVTWNEVFRLDSDCSLSRIIRNPSDGSYGFEIEDVGFWRFPDGPPGVNAVNPPVPAPTHAAAPDPLCAAASNAAMVYVELYKRVAAELLDQVAGEFELAANLGTAISGFLMIIGAAATQPYVAIASILGLIGTRQQFLDNPLDSDDLERMTCILYDHAVQDAQGSVTFNYDGVFGDVDLPDPKQTLMRLLLGMLGGDALNAAGAVDIVASPDCSVCEDEPPQDWIALGGNGRSGLEVIPYGPHPYSISWPEIPDTYLPAEDAFKQHPRAQWSYLRLRKEFAPTLIHSWRMSWTVSHGQAPGTARHQGMNVAFFRNGVEVHHEANGAMSNALDYEFAIGGNPDNPANYIEADAVEIWFVYYLNGGSVQPEVRLTRIQAGGTGPAPL